MNSDNISTLAGGSAGLGLLASVQWDHMAHGEWARIGVAFALIIVGYFMYRGK